MLASITEQQKHTMSNDDAGVKLKHPIQQIAMWCESFANPFNPCTRLAARLQQNIFSCGNSFITFHHKSNFCYNPRSDEKNTELADSDEL